MTRFVKASKSREIKSTIGRERTGAKLMPIEALMQVLRALVVRVARIGVA